MELCTVLIRAVWDFFEDVWRIRNGHLYEGTGTIDPGLTPELTDRLLHYKQNADALLHYGDRNWILQSDQEIGSWTDRGKRGMLKVLDS